MSVYVFLGPSLPIEEAARIVDARFLPPIAAGDLCALMAEKPRAVAIVDGVFQAVPSVWHKEILFALSRGVRVFGASSMGALRAAELCAFGMEGIGRVFEMFRDGVLEDDDEVAVTHGPASMQHRATSDAMVNLRDGLARAARAGVVREETRDALVAAQKARFFSERSWAQVHADARRLGVPEAERRALERFVAEEKPNLKRDDAIACLRRLADEMARGLAPHAPDFAFNPTRFWAELQLRARRVAASRDGRSAQAVALHVRACRPDRRAALATSLHLHLLDRAAEQHGITPPAPAIDETMARLRVGAPSLPDAELRALAIAERVEDVLAAQSRESVDANVRLALARDGALREIEDHLERRQRFLRERGFTAVELQHAGIDLDALLAWHRARTGAAAGSVEDLAAHAGIPSPRAFVDELLREYLFARHTA